LSISSDLFFQSNVTPCSLLTLSKADSIGLIFSFNLTSDGEPNATTSPVAVNVPFIKLKPNLSCVPPIPS